MEIQVFVCSENLTLYAAVMVNSNVNPPTGVCTGDKWGKATKMDLIPSNQLFGGNYNNILRDLKINNYAIWRGPVWRERITI